MTTASGGADALAAEWDQRYTDLADKIPDSEPNAVLIAEVGGLPSGRALDIGCGTGAEAIWLTTQGWKVTALDVSHVVIDRAKARAARAGVDVAWVQGRLEDLPLPADGFDLVTAHYPALLHSPRGEVGKALVAAVAPGGTLLVVHHADVDAEAARAHGFEITDFVSHDDFVALLDDGWDVRIDRRRPRDTPAGIDGQHTHDDVIHARRRS